MGKWQEALQDADRAVQFSPKDPVLYDNRAHVYEELARTATNERERAEYQRRADEDSAMYDRLTAGR
jgi:regulator of sirC expression with transglutaminase-like and TPR domain